MEAANKQARQDGKRLNTEEAIFANIMNQRRLVQQAVLLPSNQRRQVRLPTPAELSPASVKSRTNESRSTEIEPFPVEIWESE
jgi:hypothetical protein